MAVSLNRLTSGDDATTATTSTTASIVLSGNPVFIVLGSPALQSSIAFGTVTWNGGAQNFSGLVNGDADGTNDATGRILYLDAPTPGTDTITINHANLSTRRSWDVFEVSGHDTSSSTAWRDAASAAVQNGTATTTHEVVVTSAVGDYPFSAVVLRQASSAPTLTANGSSTAIVSGHLAGTTLRTLFLTGAGAASITLGGTTGSSTQSVVLGFNINAAAAGSAIAVKSSTYMLRGMR